MVTCHIETPSNVIDGDASIHGLGLGCLTAGPAIVFACRCCFLADGRLQIVGRLQFSGFFFWFLFFHIVLDDGYLGPRLVLFPVLER